jgi:hypothetical protein
LTSFILISLFPFVQRADTIFRVSRYKVATKLTTFLTNFFLGNCVFVFIISIHQLRTLKAGCFCCWIIKQTGDQRYKWNIAMATFVMTYLKLTRRQWRWLKRIHCIKIWSYRKIMHAPPKWYWCVFVRVGFKLTRVIHRASWKITWPRWKRIFDLWLWFVSPMH